MIRKLLVASIALAAVAAFTLASHPVEAGCTTVTAKSRGLSEANVSDRSVNRLGRKEKRWGKKNDLSVVRVSSPATSCSAKGPFSVCTSMARACS
jgi:hypothetical protein